MKQWLTYERGPVHEGDPAVLQEWDVVMPRLADTDGSSWSCFTVQQFADRRTGKTLWRALDPQRKVWGQTHVSRESAAQACAQSCPRTLEHVSWRLASLAARAARP